mmetsp:Transcript_4458/g.6721  ORF Transcript_4458/g.6721 Transcript_4458/m.6721 type:complete len:98 (+) Transcript_4458:350-643(+)|eukprot:CAMPEP_0201515560 /NCGR_PEP_ID=MMETSP0161_2-20130828/7088_1 /ASSEMBLY_ACC=CAM_ASM_000251 /TAXON_ID=180227 /ORGANISM="Neoparamoeba aestuarina, Strain SoJaBio B1-5/56/2" /LENGTH=97 /DNA_ID=CAMNT_0047912415 /DNA_START=271 /DNA_END=564 /DNA_ORIENTATION=+
MTVCSIILFIAIYNVPLLFFTSHLPPPEIDYDYEPNNVYYPIRDPDINVNNPHYNTHNNADHRQRRFHLGRYRTNDLDNDPFITAGEVEQDEESDPK